jgi:hypothetical protein
MGKEITKIMMILARSVFVFLLLAFSIDLHGASVASNKATVEITAVTVAGELVDTGYIELITDSGPESSSRNFRGLKATNVPYGKYRLKSSVPGFKIYEQYLGVFQPLVRVRVGLAVSEMTDEPPRRITGRVVPPPEAFEKLWIKLVPVLSSDILMDSVIEPDGSFQFIGMQAGEYILILIRGNKSIYSTQISAFGTKEVTITVPKEEH